MTSCKMIITICDLRAGQVLTITPNNNRGRRHHQNKVNQNAVRIELPARLEMTCTWYIHLVLTWYIRSLPTPCTTPASRTPKVERCAAPFRRTTESLYFN